MQNAKPKISIVIPYHDIEQTAFFLSRALSSIAEQNFKDYEVVLVKEGLPGKTINTGIHKAKGELIKILCMDDWFAHPNALKDIVDNFKEGWLVGGSHNNPHPYWTKDVPYGYNTLGGLSSVTIENKEPVLFEEDLKWMIDVEFYSKAFKKWGEPTILDGVNVNIGLGEHQLTLTLSEEEKLSEFNLVSKKYV